MNDVTVIGAGLAGLQVARLVARSGAKVLLVDARRDVTDFVRTTGIFVRRTFEDFAVLEPFLGCAVRRVALHSPKGEAIELASSRDEFRVARMKPLYRGMLEQARGAGVEWMPSATVLACEERSGFSEVRFRDGRIVLSRFVVGADGACSRIARELGLDQNHRWITGVEHVYPSSSSAEPRFDCFVDPRIAPGYLAWLVDDGEEVHVGVGGERSRFEPIEALRTFEARLRKEGRLPASAPTERRGGLIPVNGILRRIGNARGLLVGDAAGAVSPLTAGGLDACMRLSEHAAAVLLRTLEDGRGIRDYDGAAYRTRFASRIVMRRLFDLGTRSLPLIELGFTAARLALGSSLVRHVFFGRGSFPDVKFRGRVEVARG